MENLSLVAVTDNIGGVERKAKILSQQKLLFSKIKNYARNW